ncbi:polyphosphate polymerase domain-containing protein [Parabacteroides sp. FAFU027]|uniref:polyphosphate polymerase domain-containing protein n=1 Tax=Parabacteroides sp. FAFU027 TaxID=2922715 RepID=UPI001FAEBB44|nr:polyphosphate polymerase domain-containing protein [Parabacteroides sp. FAFU027]
MDTMNSQDQIRQLLLLHDPITLGQMEGIRLMNRIDRKFMTNLSILPKILKATIPLYYVQEVQGKRVSPYETIYFDTDELTMYTMHHNSRRNRQKVRMRSYVDSDLSFLEVKKKDLKGKTDKVRIKINAHRNELMSDDKTSRFVAKETPYHSSALKPQLENDFSRITLVNKEMTERLTIDFHIRFCNCKTHIKESADKLVIIEIKSDGDADSPILSILSELRIRPVSISKYCLGTVLTNPNAKHNQFKRKLVFINKLTNACF